MKYECYYAREWFAKSYDADKSLTIHKMKVSKLRIVKHLERCFSQAMTDKIVAYLDLVGNDEVYFKTFVEKLKSKLILARHEQVLKFSFDLFDYNDNKLVCMQDMARFNEEFAGVCTELVHDYNDITAVLLRKRKLFKASDVPNFDYERGEPCKPKKHRHLSETWYKKPKIEVLDSTNQAFADSQISINISQKPIKVQKQVSSFGSQVNLGTRKVSKLGNLESGISLIESKLGGRVGSRVETATGTASLSRLRFQA